MPAQPAATALLVFSKQAGAEVLFASDSVKSVRANAVVGAFEPAEALIRLLADTGLSASRSANGKWLVIASSALTTMTTTAPAPISGPIPVTTEAPTVGARRMANPDERTVQMEVVQVT